MSFIASGKPVGLLIIFGLISVAFGLISAVSPRTGWWLHRGWAFSNAEPSDLGLGMTRFGGIVSVVVGIVLFFIAMAS